MASEVAHVDRAVVLLDLEVLARGEPVVDLELAASVATDRERATGFDREVLTLLVALLDVQDCQEALPSLLFHSSLVRRDASIVFVRTSVRSESMSRFARRIVGRTGAGGGGDPLEQRGSDANPIRAFFDRHFEIPRHAHRESE